MVFPALTISHLFKSYGSQPVIRDFSMQIYPQERIALFAPSGCGKSTLMHILCGILQPDSGGFLFHENDQPVTLFQEPRLFSHLTVEENIFLPYRVKRESIGSEIIAEYQQWVSVCGLEGCEKQYPFQLSGGMKQKTAFIRSALSHPSFFLMDEPLRSVDIRSKIKIMSFFLQQYPSLPLLFTTHLPDDIFLLATSVMTVDGPLLSNPQKKGLSAFQSAYYPDLFSKISQSMAHEQTN